MDKLHRLKSCFKFYFPATGDRHSSSYFISSIDDQDSTTFNSIVFSLNFLLLSLHIPASMLINVTFKLNQKADILILVYWTLPRN